MLEPQRDYDSYNIHGQPSGRQVIVTSKHASIEPSLTKNHTRSCEVEVINGTDSKSSTSKAPPALKDELFSLTGELSSLTDELSFLTGELASLTGELSSLKGKPPTRTDELSAHTDELHAHAADELLGYHTADLYSRTIELYSRIDELKEKNLTFHKKVKTTGQMNIAFVSTMIDPLETMEQDTSHSDGFKINVRLLKFFAEESSEELQKWEEDDLGDIGFFDDIN